VPPEIEAVFRAFRVCELSTLARDGTPITWPTLPFWQPEHCRFLVTTSIGLPQKFFNMQCDPRVSLLFSDPTGSGLAAPPAVLVQGDASVRDEVLSSLDGYEDILQMVFERQPNSGIYSSNKLLRFLFDWYYMRLEMAVIPRRMLVWERGDFTRPPQPLEMADVG
jgi:hypothetical protein